MDTKEIGNIIKERRKHLGVNQQTLADLAGVGLNTLVAIERGEGNPQLNTLMTILDTLGLQMDIKLKTLDYETGVRCLFTMWRLASCKRRTTVSISSPI